MRHTFVVTCSFLFLCSSPALANPKADLILHHGRIFTADDCHPWAEAIAIRNDRVDAVGSNAEVLAHAGPSTRSINLGGRLVVPGFNDAHSHFPVDFGAVQLPPVNVPGPGLDLAGTLGQVSDAVAVAAPGQPIFGTIGELTMFDPAATRTAFDAVAPNNPVILLHWTSHTGIINTRAMQVYGVDEHATDPFGGTYGRFADGTLNGQLFEYALFGVFRLIRLTIPVEASRAQYEFFSAQRAQAGYTSAQEMAIGVPLSRSVEVLGDANLKLRVRMICQPLTPEESCDAPTKLSSRVTVTGRKWLADGTFIERDAALIDPYADAPTSGVFAFPGFDLARVLFTGMGAPRKNQLLFHAIGDRAVDTLLTAIDASAPDHFWKKRRPRLEHAELWEPRDFDIAKRNGAILVQNPLHFTFGDTYEARLGPARADRAQPLRSIAEAGIPIALGSDVFAPNPFLDIFLAALHPANPAEAITVEAAVRAYTRGSAYAEFEEDDKGQLTKHYLADLVVLSQNIFEVGLFDIPATTSLMTVVGGEVVFDSGVLVPD